MLTRLSIRNIVLIEQCDLTLPSGLCVLTGETGAGKSILLDSLGLVLGMRAEARLVRAGAQQASVSAAFEVAALPGVQAALEELGLEAGEGELLIRRTLTADGKTRCFINDEAVSVAALRTLGERLVEINGQHDGQGLLDAATHRAIIDAFGELEKQASRTEAAYGAWRASADALAQALATLEQAAREKDYLEHMNAELGKLGPQEGEEAELAEARTRMMQGEKLADLLKDAQGELTSGKGAMGMLSTSQRLLARSSLGADGRFNLAIDALERAATALGEAEESLERLLEESQFDPGELERIEERLFALRGAARKYNTTPDGLAALLAEVEGKLAALRGQQQSLAGLEGEVQRTKADYVAAAEKLGEGRAKAAKKLEKEVAAELEGLRMGATQFRVMLAKLAEERWGPAGMESVQFEAATNKGSATAPLHKIASGGELSRFMLAMKVALAKVKSAPTIIFDEIDTGTGGATADAIGQRLARLGATHQVLCVTHLPQVAACGGHHLRVMKEERGGHTHTQVVALNQKERREELARMLAGSEVTNEARKAADKLLQAAG